MIPRYSRPEMKQLWSDESRFAAWLRVEIAATEVLAGKGIVPAEALRVIKEKARFEVARIDAIEKDVQHDVIAFVSNVAENVGPEGRWVHYGLTSSDVVDTALAMLMRDAVELIRKDVEALQAAIRKRAIEHRRTPDDRPHPRRARGADDLRPEARALARGARARARAASTRRGRPSRWASSPARWARFRTSAPTSRRRCARSSA